MPPSKNQANPYRAPQLDSPTPQPPKKHVVPAIAVLWPLVLFVLGPPGMAAGLVSILLNAIICAFRMHVLLRAGLVIAVPFVVTLYFAAMRTY